MGKKLTDLTERTATASTDLIHVNSGGTDYKESKANFLAGDLYSVYSNAVTITSTADSLPAPGTYFGYVAAYGHQTTVDVPANNNFYVKISRMNNSDYSNIEIWSVNDTEGGHYIRNKIGGTWSSWVHIPSRSEMNNVLLKFPSNIASFSEFNNLASSGGFYTFRTSNSFTCGNGMMPNYGRGIIMNYSSSDSSFILVCPTGFVYGFKNSGNWILKQISF